ncbi:MAG: tetratricopeptide repeat protein [Planctomycetota bacterium]
MKPALLLPVAVLVSAAASYVLCSTTLDRAEAKTPSDGARAADVERLATSLRALEESQQSLARELASLKSDAALRSSGETRVPVAEIEAAVARALAAHAPGSAPANDAPKPAVVAKKRTPAQGYEALAAAGFDWNAAQKVWKELREEGLVDDVLAIFEQKAKDAANDPAAQVELGKAYLQKLFTVPPGPEQGTWAMKADKAFDTALGIDDHDWSARFNKAVSLSNWPAFLGKQGAAAQQFETLLEQQNQGPARPEHAQTYFFLGNLYQSMGKGEQALSTWKKGLELFPDNAQLSAQVQSAQHH